MRKLCQGMALYPLEPIGEEGGGGLLQSWQWQPESGGIMGPHVATSQSPGLPNPSPIVAAQATPVTASTWWPSPSTAARSTAM